MNEALQWNCRLFYQTLTCLLGTCTRVHERPDWPVGISIPPQDLKHPKPIVSLVQIGRMSSTPLISAAAPRRFTPSTSGTRPRPGFPSASSNRESRQTVILRHLVQPVDSRRVRHGGHWQPRQTPPRPQRLAVSISFPPSLSLSFYHPRSLRPHTLRRSFSSLASLTYSCITLCCIATTSSLSPLVRVAAVPGGTGQDGRPAKLCDPSQCAIACNQLDPGCSAAGRCSFRWACDNRLEPLRDRVGYCAPGPGRRRPTAVALVVRAGGGGAGARAVCAWCCTWCCWQRVLLRVLLQTARLRVLLLAGAGLRSAGGWGAGPRRREAPGVPY
jgi:hypothetical protein